MAARFGGGRRMKPDRTPVVKDLVLLGGGHAHAGVIRRFGMRPMPGVRLTLICRDTHTPYSGMLPGQVCGFYDYDDAHIDLDRLTRFAGARFYRDEAVGLDPEARLVYCRGRPPVRYDVLSLNIGSAPSTSGVPGAAAHAVPVKPIGGFIGHWERLKERALDADRPLDIAVVGAGAGGVEILLAVQARLEALPPRSGRAAVPPRFRLITASERILPEHNAHARGKFERILGARGVQVHTGRAVSSVMPGSVELAGGERLAADEVLWVTSAGAAAWLAGTGLALDDRGFVAVDATLRSVSHPEVFAAGDIAAVLEHPRPKSGVFAVRQAAPLDRNLRRALRGRAPVPFRPQRDFLTIITTGERHAVASRGSWAVEGAWVWRWKDWIDRRFMRKFADLPEMAAGSAPALPDGLADAATLRRLAEPVMRCGGCGAKVGATVLARALGRLGAPVARPDVLVGLDDTDDAAVVAVPDGKVLVQSVDHFRPMLDDPYVFGRIAANHSLGDLFAMGAEPQSALAVVTVPFGTEEQTEEMLFQMLAGAQEVLAEAGAALVGGHTGEGPEPSLGFVVNGLADPSHLLRKSGMRPGDRLILTKPLGTGALFAADMRLKAKGRWIDAAIASMQQSNAVAAATLRRHGATACTDVTGFGLVGHLVEMLRASGVDAFVDLSAVPLLDGALPVVEQGIFSTLQPENLRLRRAVQGEDARLPAYPLLFDPQTAGGLLGSLPADRAEACLSELRAAGYAGAAIVGSVVARAEGEERIVLAPPDPAQLADTISNAGSRLR